MTAETCKHYKHTSTDFALWYTLKKKRTPTFCWTLCLQHSAWDVKSQQKLVCYPPEETIAKCRKWLILRQACFRKYSLQKLRKASGPLNGHFQFCKSSVTNRRHMKKVNSVTWRTIFSLCFFNQTSFTSEFAKSDSQNVPEWESCPIIMPADCKKLNNMSCLGLSLKILILF